MSARRCTCEWSVCGPPGMPLACRASCRSDSSSDSSISIAAENLRSSVASRPSASPCRSRSAMSVRAASQPATADSSSSAAVSWLRASRIERACASSSAASAVQSAASSGSSSRRRGESTVERRRPLDAGHYALTPCDVATLEISGLLSTSISVQPVVLEAGPGDAACRHQTVVPYPGGFDKGIGCFEAATFAFEQTGCGVGLIDSDGDSDFTVSETADTSDRAVCKVPQHPVCLSQSDQSLRLDVTVGDGVTDTCSGAGTGNVLLSIPIAVTVWIDRDGCPTPDGTYDAGFDSLVARVEQVANLTTATGSARFADLDGDGCAFAGTSAGPLATAGTCLEVSGGSLTLVATAPGSVQTVGGIVSSLRVPFTISSPSTAGGEGRAAASPAATSPVQSRRVRGVPGSPPSRGR
jgi:hypothetical protein